MGLLCPGLVILPHPFQRLPPSTAPYFCFVFSSLHRLSPRKFPCGILPQHNPLLRSVVTSFFGVPEKWKRSYQLPPQKNVALPKSLESLCLPAAVLPPLPEVCGPPSHLPCGASPRAAVSRVRAGSHATVKRPGPAAGAPQRNSGAQGPAAHCPFPPCRRWTGRWSWPWSLGREASASR